MIRPDVLASEHPHGPWSCRGCDIWETLQAAASGDTDSLRRLLERDPNLARAEYWYTQPIRLAVREGHLAASRLLLDAGADPRFEGLDGDDLTTVARDRGHEDVARLLEAERLRRDRSAPAGPAADPPILTAASSGALDGVRELLDGDPGAVAATRQDGRRPLTLAVAGGHLELVRLLLERGADPNWPEGPEAPRGAALHTAARSGQGPLVELLLAHGADPNATIDASGSATFAARTPGLRALLLEHGGTLDPFDLVWLGEDDEAVRRVAADPDSARSGCGGVLAAACTLGKHDLLERLLDAGARVPPVLTECRSYLLEDPAMLRRLLASGMDPDLVDWQRATSLHDLCRRDHRGRPRPRRTECARILLDAGARLTARDEDYRSTPLAWASRCDLPEMVELLLERGAAVQLPDDPPWATPLAWATRRGHTRVAELLREAGAVA